MFINFDLGETFDVTYTIYLGNQPIRRIMMSGPRPMLEAQFMSFVQEIAAQKTADEGSYVQRRSYLGPV